MVNVNTRHCSHDSCMKKPYFNVEGSKTAVYCRQHADDGMVDVLSKRCSQDSCTKQPGFNFVGSRTSAFCKQHAEDGMVNVRTRRLSDVSRRTMRVLGVASNVETSAGIMLDTDLLDDSKFRVRKRSMCARDGKQPPRSPGHCHLKGGVVENAQMGLSNEVSHTLSSHTFRSEVADDTGGAAVKKTGHVTSEVLAPFLDDHHAGEAIKTKMEVVVLL